MANNTLKFQLHYYFNDNNVHSMDAFVKYENEKEILFIFREVLNSFDLDITIESEALAEGGLKSIWKFIGKNDKQLKLVLGTLAAFMISAPLTYMQFENLRLDNEIKKEELKKIKQEVNKRDSLITKATINKAVKELDGDYKIQAHKSNFYRRTESYTEISKISTIQLDEKNKPVEKEKTVLRKDFKNYILNKTSVEPIIDDDALIEIVSPVLKAGNFVWRGIYKDEVISFYMLDETFKGEVLAKKYGFTNGVSIKCVLQRKRKLDGIGSVKIFQNNVIVVLEVIDLNQPSQITAQGQRYLRNKRDSEGQIDMFNEEV